MPKELASLSTANGFSSIVEMLLKNKSRVSKIVRPLNASFGICVISLWPRSNRVSEVA